MTKNFKNNPSSPVHSDHHPHLFGKTLIWNLDKDNADPSQKNLSKGLEMEAYAIARKINEGVIDSGMLQELPDGQQKKFVAAIEKYLDPKQTLEMRYHQNGTHKFGNLTFSLKNPSAQAKSPEDKALKEEVKKLQEKYENKPPSTGQALISLVEDAHGNKRLMVNVHAESALSKQNRLNLQELIRDANQIKAQHNIDIVIGGDMNAGKVALPQELGGAPSHANLNYQHSADHSAFKHDGTGIAVDAIISSDKSTKLQTLAEMNRCDQKFISQFEKEKKAREVVKKTPEDELQQKLSSSSAFKNVHLQKGHYQWDNNKDKTQQNYPVELTFQDAKQALQFNNLVAVNDRKKLLQIENKIYLSQETVSGLLKKNIHPHYELPPLEQLKGTALTGVEKKCKDIVQNNGKNIDNPPSILYAQNLIRQDTRGVIDYSMQLTFNSKEEARAFSDAMGYRNKTKLYQEGNTVYIAKDVEADFLNKVSKLENTSQYKNRFQKAINHKNQNAENTVQDENDKQEAFNHPS
ncbi:hypothetical protein E3983_03240 [Legionella israelensis]|uniref:Uncharacterized protein n=1 Tax=Legionella israelensis TaxID=454 RepID=A0AAX1EEC9_9GAMM|nr:hypothetical protein [Legionella israelensis]QBR83463.1 hypothetical protein E3983_03240 [Legionella israelensis]